jgi:hypothetical protein
MGGWYAIVYEVPGSATPRPIFNQMQYHDTNVLDDGRVPAPEPPHWLTSNTFRAQVPADPAAPCPAACPAPTLGDVTVTDPSTCNLGLLVSWDAADFPSGSGTYAVYRSTDAQGLTCSDALSRPPLVSGLTVTSWLDATTSAGGSALHVVEAEDGVAADPGCAPVGPTAGGTVARSCSAPVADEGLYPLPAGVGAVLRVGRDAGEVVLSWPDVRPLLDAEHFHVLRAADGPTGTFMRANGEGQVATAWRDAIDSAPLVLYDLRVANGCEQESPDDFPPG